MWGILRKLKDTTFTIHARTKCLLLVKLFSWKKEFISKKNSRSKIQFEEVQDPQIPEEDNMEIETKSQGVLETEPITQVPRRSGRIHHEPERYGFLITDDPSIVLVDQDEPTSYREAIESLNSAKWLRAIGAEMQSMYDNQVWTLVDPREGVKIIECKWIFKKRPTMSLRKD